VPTLQSKSAPLSRDAATGGDPGSAIVLIPSYMLLAFSLSAVPSIDRVIIGSARQDGPLSLFSVVLAMDIRGINRSID
jgi:hypothetical protein